ncbi:hypothetical protein Krac_2475 [Ktedonobacter racemifer DSM 44963]|uniref:Uncharacterized protein n=1 Tax=Ktedonobacter racemifer DSM 44963 TaxID=485913 RepID=D6U5F0_KTERA|nr:hypothetical protein Krac_2475 [Ktedonobacter racemifer DSM 44963]
MTNSAYNGWTPLRNALRKLDLTDTLAVIRPYAAFRTLPVKTPFPTNMEVHSQVYSDEHLILPWEMEILAREAIIVCDSQPSTRYTARKWDTFTSLINKLRALGDYISQSRADDRSVLREVTIRIPHLQFKYQTELPSKASIIRYSRILAVCQVLCKRTRSG